MVVEGVRVDVMGVVEVGVCGAAESLASLNLKDLRLGFRPVGNMRRLDAIEVRGEVLGVK